jgi:hypothetical protein
MQSEGIQPNMTHPFVEKLKQTCMWCDNEALFECDGVIGMSGHLDEKGRLVFDELNRVELYTCDAQMCLFHRHVVGFICGGKDPGTIDMCPHCAHYVRERKYGPITKEQAECWRRETHAEIRRAKIKVQNGKTPRGEGLDGNL